MKALLFIALLLSPAFAFTQPLEFVNGGEYIPHQPGKCLSDLQREAIKKVLHQNTQTLIKNGKISEVNPRARVRFAWPLKMDESLDWNSYWGIYNYVDQQSGDGTKDFNCTRKTYDGHRGTDYLTWPFPWHLYENSLVSVIAAEAGVIISKQDGHFDQNCRWQNAGSWNAIYVRHDDGSTAWYGHLKSGELTEKAVGERVEKGEYLGIVASSGRSTGPHLHFEVYDANNRLIDPYQGSCNTLNGPSWWEEQHNHLEPNLNTVLTHSTFPLPGCPSASEKPNFKDKFIPTETVFMTAYLRDQMQGDSLHWTIAQPDGEILNERLFILSGDRIMSYWTFSHYLPEGAPRGTYTITAQYRDQSFVREFLVGGLSTSVANFAEAGLELFPVPAKDFLQIKGLQKPAQFNMYNMYGELVAQKTLNANGDISITNLASGIYVATVQLDGKVYQKRVVVMK